MRSNWLALVSVLAAFGASAESVSPPDVESIPAGDKVEVFRFGERVVWLPPGDWQLVSRTTRPVDVSGRDGLGRMARVLLQEVKRDRLNRLLDISANDRSVRVNWRNEPCKDQGDSFWIEDRKAGMNNQQCLRVGFATGIVDKASGTTFTNWARDLKERGIGYSPDMPFVSVTRYTMSAWLSIQVMFDPAASGIEASKLSERASNDWLPSRAAQDAPRSAFYQSLKDWAPRLARLVQENIDGDPSGSVSDCGVPTLPLPLSKGQPSTAQ